jgi:hypothetical protein
MTGYTVGRSTKFPWGIETEINIVDDGLTIASVVVTHWPDDPAEQEKRGNHLVQNYLDSLAEAG